MRLKIHTANIMTERSIVYLSIALGAVAGSIIRYEISQYFHKQLYAGLMAVSTVNWAGSLLIGVAFILLQGQTDKHFSLVMLTGFLGSLTTFSTFSLETVKLLQNHHYKIAIIFVVGQIVVGVVLCLVGMALGRYLQGILR